MQKFKNHTMFIFIIHIQIKVLWEDNLMNQTNWALKHGTTVNKSEKDNIKKKKTTAAE